MAVPRLPAGAACAHEGLPRPGRGATRREREGARRGGQAPRPRARLPADEPGPPLLEERGRAFLVVLALERPELELRDLALLRDAAVLDDGLDDQLGALDGEGG